MSINIESIRTINMPGEIVIKNITAFSNFPENTRVLFQHHHTPDVLEVSIGDVLVPEIIGYKIYSMDGRMVKEPIVKYNIKK